VAAELAPGTSQAQLVAAIHPVADRLLRRYKAAQAALEAARAHQSPSEEQEARNTLNALVLFRGDMGAYIRLYTFLSQIFDYGNAAIEKRAIFYRRLIPLLEFGREREGIDLSKVTLTHHKLKSQGTRLLGLSEGDQPKLKPLTESGGGEVRDKEKALLAEIISKVNDLFEGELTDDDKLVYVNNVLKGKLLESETLIQQAANNSKQQFSSSPDLASAIMTAIIEAFDAHGTMSKQALDSEKVRDGLQDVLLGPAQLYEALRAKATHPSP
jgi:type I restriction enzyme R subunit